MHIVTFSHGPVCMAEASICMTSTPRGSEWHTTYDMRVAQKFAPWGLCPLICGAKICNNLNLGTCLTSVQRLSIEATVVLELQGGKKRIEKKKPKITEKQTITGRLQNINACTSSPMSLWC